MILGWLNGREAAEIGAALADEFAPRAAFPGGPGPNRNRDGGSMEQLLRRADHEVRPLQLNFYKKARFANSFKWRLIENGIARAIADNMTQNLLLHLSQDQAPELGEDPAQKPANSSDKAKAQAFFHRGNKSFAQGAVAEAASLYEQAVELDSSHAEALNNLGSSLFWLGRYEEAEQCFRQAIATKPNYADPYCNLGNLLRLKDNFPEAEAALRRALKLRPTYQEARINLGLTLMVQGRLRAARAYFEKALKASPRNVHALFGLGRIATLEGRFDHAESSFKHALALDPKMASALAALPGIRRMTHEDMEWFKSAEQLAQSGIAPLEEAGLRFAMGKYCDDVGDFAHAFPNFRRGNELLKTVTEDYDRLGRSRLIDGLIRAYPRGAISAMGTGGSSSAKPVFVVGMPRSGTSLAEQIIASHPAAHGAGELNYWATLIANNAGLAVGALSEPDRPKVAAEYLQILEATSPNVLRIVDKAPANSDFLGLIHSVFPNARIIYMQRDPIDTCLSCYFQQFLTSLNFTFDLSDLAHYYREHRRIAAHWRAVLPPQFLLEVPYEELVADQTTWSRRMLEFMRRTRMGSALLAVLCHAKAGDHGQRMASAAGNLQDFRVALAQLREISGSPKRFE